MDTIARRQEVEKEEIATCWLVEEEIDLRTTGEMRWGGGER